MEKINVSEIIRDYNADSKDGKSNSQALAERVAKSSILKARYKNAWIAHVDELLRKSDYNEAFSFYMFAQIATFDDYDLNQKLASVIKRMKPNKENNSARIFLVREIASRHAKLFTWNWIQKNLLILDKALDPWLINDIRFKYSPPQGYKTIVNLLGPKKNHSYFFTILPSLQEEHGRLHTKYFSKYFLAWRKKLANKNEQQALDYHCLNLGFKLSGIVF